MDHLARAGAVATAVKVAMDSAEISIRDMAKRAPIPYVTLTRRLSGQSPFTMSELISVADVLGIDAAELVRAADAA